MRHALINTSLVLTALLSVGCITTYAPPVIEEFSSLPVVDGVITDGETVIRLARSVELTAISTIMEKMSGARVWVESESGQEFVGTETGLGVYTIPVGSLDVGTRYRLRFTHLGEEFESTYRSPQATPHLEELDFHRNGTQIQVRLNVDGEVDGPRHYMWSYEENWETRAGYNATQYLSATPDGVLGFNEIGLKYGYYKEYKDYVEWTSLEEWERDLLRGQGYKAPPPPTYNPVYVLDFPGGVSPFYYCWKNARSDQLLLGSTDMLRENTLRDHVLYEFPVDGDRLSALYHTKVIQYALADDAFFYFENQKKNSDDTGSIFAPIPSEMPGNIVCTTSPELPVIGFVEVSKLAQREVFVEGNSSSDGCTISTAEQIKMRRDAIFDETKDDKTADAVYFNYYMINDGSYTTDQCIDCRRFGGTKSRPDWWPNDHK